MAQSVAATVESASQVKVIVPPNSAISKIYTSIVQFDFEEINGGGITVTQIGGEDIFLYDFHKDPEFGNHETTFPQPLCVGSTGAEVGFISLDGDVGRNADNLRLTVVYCPNFCAP